MKSFIAILVTIAIVMLFNIMQSMPIQAEAAQWIVNGIPDCK